MAREMQVTTGLLHENTLWWAHTATGPVTAIWEPPGMKGITLVKSPLEPPARFNLPMPGMVFITQPGKACKVLAAKERPRAGNAMLYNAPTFNVFRNGTICHGTHRFPNEPERQAEAFFRSHFSLTGDTKNRSKKHDGDILSLWEELSGEGEYPLEDLVEYGTVGQEMGRG